ncbi:acetate/propionate family kinase [Parasphingopyxis algicola]|uniref:acetate/propionate family kinase n=1 Tax=Parasphingopyxis algicola TaxID=2026624 RepID=UPI0015A00532|nr:acetate/propionate family kinase [Parasphingopyxis algicola]QLC25354.1 acetate/propionate family kinase [Parasphingopyxis algicola]
MTDALLVLNAGSSSVKFALYAAAQPGGPPLLAGQIERIGDAPSLAIGDTSLAFGQSGDGHAALIGQLLDAMDGLAPNDIRIAGAGHRVVHGGARFDAPVRIDDGVIAELTALSPLAPQHQPHNLAGIEAVAAAYPDIPQVAAFDTAFHRTQSEVAEHYALPRDYADNGMIAYGFHGLSYASIALRLPALLGSGARRVVVAHLGHGCSMAALLDGRSVATTMGFTALEGLPMGTRSGSIDPGLVLHLLSERGMEIDAVHRLLYKESGLLGLSGISGDMRDLLASDAPEARFAVDYFVDRCARAVGSLAVSLDGLDALVFTGGIGENAAEIREAVAARLAWLDIRPPLAIATDEEGVIAVATARLI